MIWHANPRTLLTLLLTGLPLALWLLAGVPRFTLLSLLIVSLGSCWVLRPQVS